jgi:protoporphyrinogen oxidase
MWQRFQEVIMQHGADVRLNAKVVRLRTDDRRITRVAIQTVAGMEELPAEAVISSMPLPELVLRLDPPPPVEVLQAARSLSFRALIVVGVVINRAELFPDNWIYIHSPDVKVGRIQNPKNWSGDLVPDPETTSLALEYFCSETDALWSMSDTELIRLAARELTTIGLAQESDILDGVVFRQPKAYPVYDSQYRESVAIIRGYLDTFANLQTVGRNGLHRYNNQDHSMVTGLLAAKNLEGGHHDIWSVNTDSAYYESA